MQCKKIHLPLISFYIFLSGCTNSNKAETPATGKTEANDLHEDVALKTDSNVIKVYIDKIGTITVNGIPASFAAIDSFFKAIKKTNGIVYYSRDNTQADESGEYMKVMDLITKYGLAVKFYTDKTFTRSCKNEFCG